MFRHQSIGITCAVASLGLLLLWDADRVIELSNYLDNEEPFTKAGAILGIGLTHLRFLLIYSLTVLSIYLSLRMYPSLFLFLSLSTYPFFVLFLSFFLSFFLSLSFSPSGIMSTGVVTEFDTAALMLSDYLASSDLLHRCCAYIALGLAYSCTNRVSFDALLEPLLSEGEDIDVQVSSAIACGMVFAGTANEAV